MSERTKDVLKIIKEFIPILGYLVNVLWRIMLYMIGEALNLHNFMERQWQTVDKIFDKYKKRVDRINIIFVKYGADIIEY